VDIELVGEAKDGIEAQRMVSELRPDILLLDLVMPGPRPSEIDAWVREHHPKTITLVLTSHDRDAYLAEMVDTGTVGFLTKDKAPSGLVDAIRCAARGSVLFDQEQLLRARRWREEVGARLERLTQRERQVYRLLLDGLDNKAIADTLRVTTKTIAYHITNIMAKVGATSRLEAVVWAREIAPTGIDDFLG
jgi:DNA-binding NarL/FixJ family response regulator